MLPFWENRGGEAPVQLESLGESAAALLQLYCRLSSTPRVFFLFFFGATVVETAAAMVVAAAAATFFFLGHAKSRLFKQGEKAIEVSPARFGSGFARDFSSVSSFPP